MSGSVGQIASQSRGKQSREAISKWSGWRCETIRMSIAGMRSRWTTRARHETIAPSSLDDNVMSGAGAQTKRRDRPRLKRRGGLYCRQYSKETFPDLLRKGCYEPLFMRNQTGGGFRRSRNALPNPWLKRW